MFKERTALKFKIVVLVLILPLFIVGILPKYFIPFREGAYKLFQRGIWLLLNYQTKTYQTLTSSNFILKYTKADQELAPLVLAIAEDYLAQIEEILGLEVQAQSIPLVLYDEEESLKNSFGWSADKSAVGVYWAGTIRLVSPRGWSIDLPENTALLWEVFQKEGPLAHELTHLFVDEATGGNYPRWLTEGLAQYVEEKVTGFRLNQHFSAERSAFYPFSSLDRDFDQQQDQFLAYGQSQQAVQTLVEKDGMDRLTDLLQALRQGMSFKQAFSKVYEQDFADFEKNFRSVSWRTI